MEFKRALRAEESGSIAFVGGGGKTTAVFRLARQMPGPTWVTTTTHLGVDQVHLADRHVALSGDVLPDAFIRETDSGVSLVTGAPSADHRVGPPHPDALEALHELSRTHKIPLIIEADGSKGLPIKAPADHEPAIPAWVNAVVVVVGLSGLGQPLDAAHVHRPERFGELSGLHPGEHVSPASLARVLVHPLGGIKNIPGGARRLVLFNQADATELLSEMREQEGTILAAFHSILYASLGNPTAPVHRAVERMAGIVLAAGAARRLGRPKQILDFSGEPFVRRVARTALEAGCSPVVVVSGSMPEEVGAAVEDLPVQHVVNPHWDEGQSTSIRVGLQALPEEIGGAVFLLADQPQIPARVVRGLIDLHQQTLDPLVAPRVGERRANPVLFDRTTFPDLLALTGDIGGRGIFKNYPLTFLEVEDDSLLMDVDTEEDLRLLREWSKQRRLNR